MGKSAKKPAKRAKAISLHLGLNSVSPAHYGGWTGDLNACEFDARDMEAIAKARGMAANVLLTKKATRTKVLAALRQAAGKLASGDLFFLSFSGHGGQIPDATGEEADAMDETWCLYDSQLIDDELYFELSRFAAGVRILVLSDSCHSGTVTRAAPPIMSAAAPARRSKMMPPAIGMRTYREHRAFYDGLQHDVAKAAGRRPVDPDSVLANLAVSPQLVALAGKFDPAVILLSGCQDNQTSLDGDHNGAFTEKLLQVWNNGAYKGDYARFHALIRAGMPDSQTPNLFTLGAAGPFLGQQAFEV